MSEQAHKISHRAVPEWAEGLYYDSGMFSEMLVYHDDESIYIEHRGAQGKGKRRGALHLRDDRGPEDSRGAGRRVAAACRWTWCR